MKTMELCSVKPCLQEIVHHMIYSKITNPGKKCQFEDINDTPKVTYRGELYLMATYHTAKRGWQRTNFNGRYPRTLLATITLQWVHSQVATLIRGGEVNFWIVNNMTCGPQWIITTSQTTQRPLSPFCGSYISSARTMIPFCKPIHYRSSSPWKQARSDSMCLEAYCWMRCKPKTPENVLSSFLLRNISSEIAKVNHGLLLQSFPWLMGYPEILSSCPIPLSILRFE